MDFLHGIYTFLKNNKDSSIGYIELHTIKGNDDIIDNRSKFSLFVTKFKSIGFNAFAPDSPHPAFDTQHIVIRKL